VNVGVRSSAYDVIITLTPDCVATLDQFDVMVDELKADPQLAQVALTMVLPDGSVEIGVGGWEPTVRRALVHAVGAHKFFPRSGLWAKPVPGEDIELDYLGAACMAFPRQVFLELGGYDESYFVYNEDMEFSRAIRQAGLRQKVLTDNLTPHLGTGSGDAKPAMLQMRGAMTMQYVSRHNTRAATQGFRAALTAGYAARYGLSRVHGRRAIAEEHAAYIRGLWAGAPDMG
jgi:GT2 family glycosyltransferase